jgi:glycerol-3-phosphate dehydrogenase
MDRDGMVGALAERTPWDVIMIGGGATGLGCAVDASSRGYRTLLLEQGDFAKGTSSRSTKLIHGGVRYLQQGNLKLVRGALRERGLLMKNAPHLVRALPFVIPCFAWWERFYYGAGLKMYDLLAGRFGIGRTEHLSRDQVVSRLPNIRPDELRGGVVYHDGQFDDARLAISLLQTAVKLGAVALNYCPVSAMVKSAGRVRGVVVRDGESGKEFETYGKVIVNCTGVFTDVVRQMDEPACERMIVTSQGAHVVLDREFLAGDTALIVPKTKDGRVLFAIPWNGKTLIGTTDTPMAGPALEPRALNEEISFILEHAAMYLARAPAMADIRSTFAGLRPLVKKRDTQSTALVPRDHTILVSASGLVTITGGKWTTYRKMAEETIDTAERIGELGRRPARTADLPLEPSAVEVKGERLHARLPYTSNDVAVAVRQEMARTVEDVLARRTRALFLDAKASMEMAPRVATIMARELGRDEAWEAEQVRAFTELAKNYLPAV